MKYFGFLFAMISMVYSASYHTREFIIPLPEEFNSQYLKPGDLVSNEIVRSPTLQITSYGLGYNPLPHLLLRSHHNKVLTK